MSSIKDTIALALITLVAGLLLGCVYEITKEPIANEQKKAKENAYKAVYEEAQDFNEIKISKKLQKKIEKQGFDAAIDEAFEVKDKSGDVIGYVMTVTDHEGYGGDIQFAMGVSKEGECKGISFLSIGETAGLGMKAKEDDFKNQFAGKNVSEFVYTKNGASNENEIDALSGATITTNAVTNGVNTGLYFVSILK